MQIKNDYIIAGNWKMNGDAELVLKMLAAIHDMGPIAQVMTIICPPFNLIHAFSGLTDQNNVFLGSQNCSDVIGTGARTGEISAAMLKQQGCEYVILGHSECREHGNEENEKIAAKVKAARSAGLTPIICVGETLEEKQSGLTHNAIEQQVKIAISEPSQQPLIIAYEPIWAIGSGKTATHADIEDVHSLISRCAIKLGHQKPSVLYGGSVKLNNALGILETPGVDGVLLGGAAIDPQQFVGINKLAGQACKNVLSL